MTKRRLGFFLIMVFFACLAAVREVRADPDVIIQSSTVEREWLDVGQIQNVAFRLVWASNHQPLVGATVYINGIPVNTDSQGHAILSHTSYDVGQVVYMVTDVMLQGSRLSYINEADNPSCIFDKVVVELSPQSQRISLGEEAEISWRAYYDSNGMPFNGSIELNTTRLTYDHPTIRYITVKKIDDREHGFYAFESNSVQVAWDRVKVTLYAPDPRVDVGEEADLDILAYYETDMRKFDGEIYLNDSLTKHEVGRYAYTVTGIEDHVYDVDVFESNTRELIFDRLIFHLEAVDERIPVNFTMNITWRGWYQYDNYSFQGTIRFDNPRKTSDHATTHSYTVFSVFDPIFGIRAHESNTVNVTWDRLRVELVAKKTHLNLGDRAQLSWCGYYEADGQEVELRGVKLNTDTLSMDEVGEITYRVVDLEFDDIYGLGGFTSDEVTVVWDKVQVEIDFPHRFEAGGKAEPTISTTYASDGSKFTGEVNIDGPATTSEPGIYAFSVESIEDRRNGITGFTAEEAYCRFDNLEMDTRTDTVVPGRSRVFISVRYQSDNSPVADATVSVSDTPATHVGNGIYVASVSNFSPLFKLKAYVDVQGFTRKLIFEEHLSIGNAAVLALILLAAGVALFWRMRRP